MWGLCSRLESGRRSEPAACGQLIRDQTQDGRVGYKRACIHEGFGLDAWNSKVSGCYVKRLGRTVPSGVRLRTLSLNRSPELIEAS
jgi:hypothetical protein